jgi:DNA primase
MLQSRYRQPVNQGCASRVVDQAACQFYNRALRSRCDSLKESNSLNPTDGNAVSITWDDAKEQVRTATEIVDLVGSYLTLRRQGRNYVGICPWHDDSRPSLQINPERQSWRCWVCDIGGDVFSFVMKREAVEFREALELLADRAGITLRSHGKSATGSDKRALFQVLTWAERQFHEYLIHSPEAEAARTYLRQRSISDEMAGKFRLGFSPDRWDWLIQKARRESFSDEQLRNAGLTSSNEASGRTYDRFRGRLLFSIRDAQSRTVGFGGRVMPGNEDRGAKYVNSPETRLFSKSDLLYALDLVRDEVAKQRHVVVVEGYTDAMMAYQQGIKNVVAVLGTALGERHIRLLRRYCDRVTLVLDGDEAGQRRTNEILELFLNNSIDLRIATMPEGEDPCDFLLREGATAFQSLTDSATDALYHRINVATRGVNLTGDLHGANRALEEILESVANMSKAGAADVAQAQLKERQVLAHLGRRFDVTEVDLRHRLKSLRQDRRARPRHSRSQVAPTPPHVELHDWDRELLEIFVACPEIIGQTLEEVNEDQLRTDAARTIFALYRDRYVANESLTFSDVMLSVDAPETKSLIVELDEEAAKKAELRQQPGKCLEAVLLAFAHRDLKGQSRDAIRRMENDNLSDEEKLKALEKILQNQRSQQGLAAPTDG